MRWARSLKSWCVASMRRTTRRLGEHWTPRDAVRLMANLVFLPIADEIESGTYLVYDGACGTGGMLTVRAETLEQLAKEHGKEVSTYLYGQEINAETAADRQVRLPAQGRGGGRETSSAGPSTRRSLTTGLPRASSTSCSPTLPTEELEERPGRMGGKAAIRDPRFVIQHAGDPEYSLLTRSSDGQMLFLANMLSTDEARHQSRQPHRRGPQRLVAVHRRRRAGREQHPSLDLESDWLEAIVALPLNMFYNTGIATYVWVLTNRKSERRRGRVQLIDARSGTARCARTSGARTASSRKVTSSGFATPSSRSRRASSRRFSRTPPSATRK